MDQEIIDAADHGLDFWAFDNYAYIQDVPQISNQKPLYEGFKEYLASPNKNRLKFAIAISPGESSAGGYIGGYWNSGEVPYLVSQFKDPQYLKVNGDRPVLFVLGAKDIAANFPNWPQDHAFLNKQSEAAGLGDPIIIDTSMDVISSKNSGLDGLTTYGVMGNGAKPESGCTNDAGNPTPHCPFSSQSTKDESNWATAAQSGLLTVPGLTPVNDPRALTTPYGFYVDQPTYTQWEQEVKDAFAFMKTNVSKTNPPIAVIYAWNELNEGGPGIIPTKQNGMMYLDAIKAVKSGTYPSNYQDIYNGDNTAISLAANPGYPNHWTNYFPVSAAGYFNNDEEISQGIGESATLSVDNVTGFEVKATKGPNRGKMQVFIDGVSQGTVNVNSATWLPGQSVFKSSTLSPGTHVLKLYNVSTDEGATSIGIDQILVSKSR